MSVRMVAGCCTAGQGEKLERERGGCEQNALRGELRNDGEATNDVVPLVHKLLKVMLEVLLEVRLHGVML